MVLVNKKISLENVFRGLCEHIQCQHNEDGECIYDEHIPNYMEYNKNDNCAICNAFVVKDGYCEECGKKLKKYVDYYPYGDTYVPYEYYACPNC